MPARAPARSAVVNVGLDWEDIAEGLGILKEASKYVDIIFLALALRVEAEAGLSLGIPWW